MNPGAVPDEQSAADRATAASALLARHLVRSDEPEWRLVRRHANPLAAAFERQLGYRLVVVNDSARLFKRFDPQRARPLVLPPRTVSDQQRAIDERRVLDAARCQIICLVCAVLEREGLEQVPLGALADKVAAEARVLELADIDYTQAPRRAELADAVDWLEGMDVLQHRSGETGSHGGRGEREETLYDVHRRRLALLLADPIVLARARKPAETIVEQAYPPTAEGDASRLRHKVMRGLVEDPVVYRDELDAEAEEYFLSQRAPLEREAAALTGLDIERRLEGTALVGRDRELTDRPFPARSHRKQLALLLLPELCAGTPTPRAREEVVLATWTAEQVRERVRSLCRRHAQHWPAWDPNDAARMEAATARALTLLEELLLVRVDDNGTVELRPAAYRYRSAAAKIAATQTALELDE